jgi:rhomboid family GlyGly-CTERM serine protease
MSLRSPHGLPAPLTAALAGGALILLLQLMDAAPPALEYRRAALAAEPWRLLTGHLVHVNWTHALINIGAWLALAWLFAPQLDARRQLLCLALGAPFISLVLAGGYPTIAWYRGASGALHALYFAGVTTAVGASLRARSARSALVPLALLAAGWIKVAVEQPGGSATPHAEWLAAATVPQAHLLGALAGTLLGLLFAALRRQQPGFNR